MKKFLSIKILIFAVISLGITLSLTRFEYGHNIWNRYCTKESAFSTDSICKEATIKRGIKSEEFEKQNYFYLSIHPPFIGASQDFKNPTFTSSTTVSQWRYALTTSYFYISSAIVFILLIAIYFSVKKLLKRKSR